METENFGKGITQNTVWKERTRERDIDTAREGEKGRESERKSDGKTDRETNRRAGRQS